MLRLIKIMEDINTFITVAAMYLVFRLQYHDRFIKHRRRPLDSGVNKEFIELTKTLYIKGKMNKQDCLKIKNFCSEKDPAKHMKQQAGEWETISASHIANRTLSMRVHNELSKLNIKIK